ncbi:MAG: Unknown protein [uncultured Aureispira sp.]|uniref:DUF2029 domain-containing protein n=1 Tax=uncultured Aureispira sp. TaxID=1331704 RepID=A0A6S6TWA6_9BACT|nr:MAG: Unknown protein [uncultured Aureispira sp.]
MKRFHLKHNSNTLNLSKNRTNILLYSPLLLLLGYCIWKAYFLPIHDFSNAYIGAVFLKEGWWTSGVYDAFKLNTLAAEKGFTELFLAYYPNTPFLAFFFYPTTYLSPLIAKLCFNLLSGFLLLLALVRAQKRWALPPWVLGFLPLVFFTSLKNGLYFGQVYFLLFFLLIEGRNAFQKKKTILGAFCWGTALMLKVFPVLLGVLLLVEKRYKALLFYIGVCLAWLAISLLQMDWATWWYYFKEVLPKSAEGAYYDGFTPAAKSATMLFKNLFVYDKIHNPMPVWDSYTAYHLAQAIYKTSIISTAILFTWKSRQQPALKMGFWIIACLLLSPGLSSYASILLLFPWLTIFRKEVGLSKKQQFIFSILVAMYANIPITYFYSLPLLFKFPKVYLLLALFVCYYQFLPKNQAEKSKTVSILSLVIGLFLFFVLPSMFKNKPPQNDYVLIEEEQILTIDYWNNNGKLEYEYWTVPKPKTILTERVIKTVNASAVRIENGQVYYKNTRLTNTKGNKRKPLLINAQEVFYLSDQNRGIGFYTLMKVDLDAEKGVKKRKK